MSYDPTISEWTSEDPAGYVNGPNLYEFEGDNPATRLDPNGTDSIYSPGSFIALIMDTTGYNQLLSNIHIKCDTALKKWAQGQGCKDSTGSGSVSAHSLFTYDKSIAVDQATIGEVVVQVTANGSFTQTAANGEAQASGRWTLQFNCQKNWNVLGITFKHYDLSWSDLYNDQYSHKCSCPTSGPSTGPSTVPTAAAPG
jgi:hypothetical protein